MVFAQKVTESWQSQEIWLEMALLFQRDMTCSILGIEVQRNKIGRWHTMFKCFQGAVPEREEKAAKNPDPSSQNIAKIQVVFCPLAMRNAFLAGWWAYLQVPCNKFWYTPQYFRFQRSNIFQFCRLQTLHGKVINLDGCFRAFPVVKKI